MNDLELETPANPAEFDDLDGLITPTAGTVLYGLARRVPADQSIVELGSFKGASTCWLAAGARDGNKPRVFAVDAWSPEVTAWARFIQPRDIAEFEAQVRDHKLWSRVTPLQGLTTEMAEGFPGKPVGLLFIDADHALDAVLGDFHAWLPHLAPGATIAFDDFGRVQTPEVEKAVEILFKGGYLRNGSGSVHDGRMLVCELADAVETI